MVDGYFIADLFLNLRTSYMDGDGNEIVDTKRIAKRYLVTWFTVDLLSSIPFDLFYSAGVD